MQKLTPLLLVFLGLGLGLVVFRDSAAGQALLAPQVDVGSGFTYQGRLDLEGAPADGTYDFQFRLFDAATGGSAVGTTVTVNDVDVEDGLFTVVLDFGANAFDGQARWLRIAVREGSSTGAYSTLSPRQSLTATPYALFALQAGSVAWADVQNRPANVLVVAQSGGDYSSIQAALDGITDAGAANPYLVYVAPGVYEEQVTLKPYVTLQGAGEESTIIHWTGGSQPPWEGAGSATLTGADNASLRDLTLESDGAGEDFAVALFNDGVSPTISHVTARALNAGDTRGVAYYGGASGSISNVTAIAADGTRNHAITSDASSPKMRDMTAIASGGDASYAVLHWIGSTATMMGLIATASGGTNNFAVWVNGATPILRDVAATASGGSNSFGVYNLNSAAPVMNNVTASGLDATSNYGVFNLNASPSMIDVRANALGGTATRGVFNSNSSPQMVNVVVTASDGAADNHGVYNYNSTSLSLTDVTIKASGSGSSNYAVSNEDSSPQMTNVVATASGGANNYGAWNTGSSPLIRQSVLEGSTNSVYASGGAVQVANSQLIGPVGAGVTCFDNYDQSLVAATCSP